MRLLFTLFLGIALLGPCGGALKDAENKDTVSAAEFRKAAEQGDAVAQSNLG
ncbi:MAG: hypothetical protein ACI9NQ_002128, partial [Paracoccaceae bacterium]